MKPAMFCMNNSGVPRWPQSWMKCVAFSDDSLNSKPLLATMPTGMPRMWAKPQTTVGP